MSKRNPQVLGIWGDAGTRPVAAESYWKLPLAWDKAAANAGERHRVFCSSLADVFENRDELHPHRLRLLDLIRQTPNLDWLLLTKRPENITPALEVAWVSTTQGQDLTLTYDLREWLRMWLQEEPPANVWLGTSVENQEVADKRIPHLLQTPAAVRFLSCEPLLGPVNIWHRLGPCVFTMADAWATGRGIDWVIAGGESGPNARPLHPDWARKLRGQCQDAGVPFLFKQWGEWLPFTQGREICQAASGKVKQTYFGAVLAVNPAGALMTDATPGITPESIYRVGKHAAGRLLDGKLWDEFPARP